MHPSLAQAPANEKAFLLLLLRSDVQSDRTDKRHKGGRGERRGQATNPFTQVGRDAKKNKIAMNVSSSLLCIGFILLPRGGGMKRDENSSKTFDRKSKIPPSLCPSFFKKGNPPPSFPFFAFFGSPPSGVAVGMRPGMWGNSWREEEGRRMGRRRGGRGRLWGLGERRRI